MFSYIYRGHLSGSYFSTFHFLLSTYGKWKSGTLHIGWRGWRLFSWIHCVTLSSRYEISIGWWGVIIQMKCCVILSSGFYTYPLTESEKILFHFPLTESGKELVHFPHFTYRKWKRTFSLSPFHLQKLEKWSNFFTFSFQLSPFRLIPARTGVIDK